MDEIHFPLYDRIHVVADIFRVGGHDRAVVVVVGILELIAFKRNGGVENVPYPLVDQPLYMPVRQFCRIAFRLAGNRLNPKFIDLSGGNRGKYDPELQFCKKRKPERIVFINIEHPWDADHPALRILFFKRRVSEIAFQLIFEQIGHLAG